MMDRKKMEMSMNSVNQAKLKASEFIENYERQLTERQFQKQKLKQNIMLQIMSNRHKSQKSDSIYRQNNRSEFSQQDSVLYKKMQSKLSEAASQERNIYNHSPNYNEQSRSLTMPEGHSHEIQPQFEEEYVEVESHEPQRVNGEVTFKVPKGKNSYIFIQGESTYSQKQEEKEQLSPHQQMTFRDEKMKISAALQDKVTSRSKKLKLSEPSIQSEELPIHSQKLAESMKKSSKEAGGLFLTVDEDQSMDFAEENKKNCAFDIMESDPNEDIQDLRKKKIEELQRKRKERRQENLKKNEEKKSESSVKDVKNFGRKSEQKISDDPQPEPPRLRNKQKIPERQNRLTPKENSHDAQYGVKPVRRSTNQMEKQKIENNSYRPITTTYTQTPKTIQSQNRQGKSRNKNTIFRQSPSRQDKSASKYLNEPKIQPKQRKNTFIKQSNKKLMMTAISNVCLPGEINKKDREKLLDVIESEQADFFVFLFKQYSRKVIKAIYVLDSTQTTLQKIYGEKAPYEIISEQVSCFYRFDSGCREFKKLDGCKSFSLVVHAIDLR